MSRADEPITADHAKHHGGLAGAVRTVSGITFLSRLGGLFREVLMARVFGDTALGSAFAAAFAIPNMFRRLFGEGALSAAFLPEYTGAEKADPAHAQRFASLTVGSLAIFTCLLTAVIEIALLLTLWLVPHSPDRDLSLRLIMVMLPFMPFICIAAILGGMLQVHGRFGPPASGPLVLNGFIIGVGLWHVWQGTIGDRSTAYALGIATTLSGVSQAAWFMFLLRRHVRWTRAFGDARDRARRMVRRMVPVLVGLGTLQVNSLVDQLVAMWPIWIGPMFLGFHYPLDPASGIILSAGQRLYQFPLGVFGIAVATAVFPVLSRQADEPEHFAVTLRRGVRLSLFIGLPASVGVLLVRHDAMSVFYSFDSRGFSAGGIARGAAVLLGYAPAIWAYSLNQLFSRAFYARGDTVTPMKVALGMVALNLALNWTLIWWLGEAGLAWSTSISATVQCLLLGWLCRSRLGAATLDSETAAGIARVALAAAVMGAAVWTTLHFLGPAQHWKGHALRLGAACGVGLISYPLLSVALRVTELRWLLHRSAATDRPGDERASSHGDR